MTAALMIRIEVFPDQRAVFANFARRQSTDRVLSCQAGPNLTPPPRLISAEGLSC
jgi:hypothetical protein